MNKLLATLLLTWTAQISAKQFELVFDVFLNDSPIGIHRVQIAETTDQRRVKVEAEMAVDFLFFTAFSYRHSADETWQRNCVTTLRTVTNDDGEKFHVTLEPEGDGSRLTTKDDSTRLEGCVRTYAYWNPELLDSAYLLNTQNGAYEEARLIKLDATPLNFNGKTHGAQHYRLEVGSDIRIYLWYDQDRSWRALQTEVGEGRILRYVRREG